VVEQRDADAERHLEDAHHDGDLHLERVEEGDLVVGHVPERVDAHGVDGARELAALARHAGLPREHAVLEALPARGAEEAHRVGEGLNKQTKGHIC